jgi:LPXTG-motif cell wall-anchored protein
MSDGNLTLGDNSQIGTLHTPLVIEGRIGSSTSLTEVDLSQFKVLLLNNMPTLSSDGKSWSYGEEDIIGTATADINGAFTIESDKEYDSEGTYTYYLIEDTGTQVNVAYDKTMYTLSVDVKEYSDELGVSFNVFNVDNVAVAKSNSGLTTIISDDDLYTLSFNTLKFNDAIFTNEIVIPIYMRLSASDSITGDKLKGAQFNLYEVVDGIASDIVIASGVSDKEGNVEFHDPDDNNRIIQVKRNATYYLEEVAAPNGYVKAGPWIVNVDNEAKATLEEVIADTDDEYSSDTKRRAKARMTNVNEFESEETSMSITLYTDIPNSELSYQLPETGGIGTFQFTIGGTSIAVIAGLLLWYKNKKRRKEGFASM